MNAFAVEGRVSPDLNPAPASRPTIDVLGSGTITLAGSKFVAVVVPFEISVAAVVLVGCVRIELTVEAPVTLLSTAWPVFPSRALCTRSTQARRLSPGRRRLLGLSAKWKSLLMPRV